MKLYEEDLDMTKEGHQNSMVFEVRNGSLHQMKPIHTEEATDTICRHKTAPAGNRTWENATVRFKDIANGCGYGYDSPEDFVQTMCEGRTGELPDGYYLALVENKLFSCGWAAGEKFYGDAIIPLSPNEIVTLENQGLI